MMELTCAFILVSASLVFATPHGYGGYGVKGGASARADASASAGAFGGVPVPVPLGAGYSGSFSKSSSSSSASSSASASSSSSSFSYSGSGAAGFGLNGGVSNHGGCSAGNCHTAGGNGTPHGASAQGYNSANAAASAVAGAVPELGCQGLSCDDNSDKCKSGPCKSKPHSGTTSINSDSKKCTSGLCGSAYENGATPTDYDSNDIRAVSDSSHNVNDQIKGTEKSSYDAAGSDCSHGKCGSSGFSNSKSNDYGHDSGNYYQGSSASDKQQGSSFDAGITSQYQKPSSHLETPKVGSKCTSGNCYAGPAEPGHETSPSSYNVPIHGAYDKGIPKPSCDGVKCENQPKEPHSPTDNTVTKGPSSYDYPSSMNCGGSSCFGIPAIQATGRPTHTVRPSEVQFGHSPSSAPALGLTGCNSPNCSPYPTNPAGSIAAPGHIGHGKPVDVNKVSNDKLPAYTGGFGGPAGILNPNEYDFSAPSGKPSHGPISTHDGKPLEAAPTGCNSPSCSGYPSASKPTSGSVPEGTYNHQPGGNPSEKLPTYTGGFGGPGGMLKPNEYGVHGTGTNNPNYAHNGRPSYNTQPLAGNTGTLGCKIGENCGGYNTPTADATAGATAPSGYYGTTKPNTGIYSNDGFGGPGVIFNPDKHYSHATGPSTAAPHAQAEPFGVTKPSSGPHLSSVTLPAYTSSYDRPGVHKPSDVSGPASTPSFTHSQPAYSPGSYSTGCKTGNCASGPTSGPSAGSNAQSGSGVHGSSGVSEPASTPSFTHSQPQYFPGSYSTGCKTGNCASGPTSGSSVGANAQSGYGVHGSSGVSGPASTPSFTLSQPPYSPGSYTTSCKTGNCASGPTSGPSAGANAQSGSGVHGSNGVSGPASTPSFTHSQPSYSPGSYSNGCKTGNCASGPTNGPSAGANAQSGSGVHGSSGVSSPASTPSFTHSQPQDFPGSYSTGCKTGNCASGPTSGSSAGANAQSGSGVHGSSGVSGPASTSSFTHSQPQDFPGSYSTGCKTGNCASGPTSGPSAGANAQSGYGVHGSSGVSGPASTPSFTLSQPPYSPGSYTTGCKTGNCANGPISGANAQSGSFVVTKPNPNVNTAPTHPQYTGGFGGPSGTFKPNEHTYVTPPAGSAPTNCRTPNCVGSPSGSADATSGANAQPGSYGVTKPSGENNPSSEKPLYTGGFGGAAGLLKPNEYTIPAASSKPNNKPIGVPITAACTSGNCNTQPLHSSAPHSGNAASGAHATAATAAAAEANAVVYSGGFGGPPGVLAPYDNGKIGALPTNGKQDHGPQTGGAHGSYNANINSQHGTIPVANGGPSGHAAGHENTGAQAASSAGATAYAGAAAGASAGAHGYSPQGSHYNHEGNIKGGSPCGGGCGGSGGGAYNGGSGSSSGAAAKSLSGANAFGVGGSYASSSASAHASAGAYTKGGYGKR